MKMKKLLSLLLAVVFVATAFAGCSSDKESKDDDKGAIIQTFLTVAPSSLDPSAFYASSDTVKLMGLVYEGLTTIDENGKLQKALAKEWEYDVDERDDYLKLEITLNHTRWSDGIVVDADDFIYAWTRILLPENKNDNAALLYPIRNAKAVKEGLCSVNDLGVTALKDDVIEIVFEKEFTDVEYFLRTLSSPALVPLREEIVSAEGWYEPGNTNYVTNGPFRIKSWTNSQLELERSVYYRGVSDNESTKDDKIVKPYRIINLYSEGKKPDDQYERFQNEELFYLSLNGASAELYDAVSKKAKVSELLSTYCLFFDLNDPVLSDVRVRQALSLAVDRNELAQAVINEVKPATGLVPAGIEDTTRKKDFRKEGGELISATADMTKAKELIAQAKSAGVKVDGHKICLEVSNTRDFEESVLSHVKQQWEQLGFKVETKSQVKTQKYLYSKANGIFEFNQNDANMLALDFQSMTTDAYGMLTSFSSVYGGKYMDITTGDDIVYGKHFTGFADSKYDEICTRIVNAADTKARTAAMHEAEEYLIEQMPAIPLFFNVDTYISQKLSNIEQDKYGRLDLIKLKQKSYKKYLPVDEDELAK